MKRLDRYLKRPSTMIVDYKPETCPACDCMRFGKIESTSIDNFFNRDARFICRKCKTTTLFIEQQSLNNQA